jgi:hypothetical protein
LVQRSVEIGITVDETPQEKAAGFNVPLWIENIRRILEYSFLDQQLPIHLLIDRHHPLGVFLAQRERVELATDRLMVSQRMARNQSQTLFRSNQR